jgi:hypothetical protein
MAQVVSEDFTRSSKMSDGLYTITTATDGTVDYDTSFISGTIERVSIIPNTDADQPDDAFDVVINDKDVYDILQGSGANCSNATVLGELTPRLANNGPLNILITNAGNTKKLKIRIYYK